GPLIRWAVLLWWPEWSTITEPWTFTRLDTIAAGCLLALLSRFSDGLRWLDGLAKWWPLFLASLAAGLAAAMAYGKVSVGVTPTVTALTIPVLVWAAARRAPRWLEHPVAITIGIGSYSLYLWQQPFLNPHSPGWWAAFPQNLLLAGLCAFASYRLIEQP